MYQILWRLIFFYTLPSLGISGARDWGSDQNGLRRLHLNKNSMLGGRGTEVFVPRDNGIYESIVVNGEWQANEASFFASQVIRLIENEKRNTIFVDIGANVGLWSCQISNLIDKQATFHLVEPVEKFCEAIVKNWGSSRGKKTLRIWPVALAENDGEGTIYIEESNKGNSSLIRQAMGNQIFQTCNVKIMKSSKFFEEIYEDKAQYFIKIDAQGQDALILSQIPPKILKKTGAVVFEMWSIPTVSEIHVEKALLALREFKAIILWRGSPEVITLDILKILWLSKKSVTFEVFCLM